MGLFDKKNEIKIGKDDLRDAKLSSSGFKDSMTKKRAFINVLGARLGMKFLFERKIEANNVYSLYSIQNILKRFDIADIYFESTKIDVRLVFNKNEIFIPKSHFDNNLLPDIYLILELNPDFTEAGVLGCVTPDKINKANANKEYYFVEAETLEQPDEIKKILDSIKPKSLENVSGSDIQTAKELFLTLVDEEISTNDLKYLINQLTNSFSLRESLVEFENFELISSKVAKDDSIMKDSVLDIIGSQQIFEDAGATETQAEKKAEIIGEVLSDLIDEDENNEEDKSGLNAPTIIPVVAPIVGAAAVPIPGVPAIDLGGIDISANTQNPADEEFLSELKDNSTLASVY